MARTRPYQMPTTSTLLFLWDVLVLVSATWFAVRVPLHAIFEFELIHSSFAVELAGSAIFLADIFISLNTIRNNKVGMAVGLARTEKEYFRGLFIFDLLAVIPIGLFTPLLFPGVLRLAKMVRAIRILYAWRHLSVRYSNYIAIAGSAYWITLIVHWMGCGWLAIRGCEPGVEPLTAYVEALYWTVSTVTSVGYGDIVPVGTGQMLYAIVCMIAGLLFFGYLVGNIAGSLFRKDPAHDHYVANLERLSVVTRYYDLPKSLQQKILDFFTYSWSKNQSHFEADFLNSLPEGLRGEVALHLKQDIIEKSPLFQNAGDDFLMAIAHHLQPRLVAPGDAVCLAGEIGMEMYFVVRGELEVLSPDGKEKFDEVHDGDYFGEIALIKDEPRNATVRAVSYCDLYVMSRAAFEDVGRQYPAMAAALGETIEERSH